MHDSHGLRPSLSLHQYPPIAPLGDDFDSDSVFVGDDAHGVPLVL